MFFIIKFILNNLEAFKTILQRDIGALKTKESFLQKFRAMLTASFCLKRMNIKDQDEGV